MLPRLRGKVCKISRDRKPILNAKFESAESLVNGKQRSSRYYCLGKPDIPKMRPRQLQA